MIGSLQDRVAIVFGASGGADGVTNGQATAMTYARVVAVDLSMDAADRTVSAITDEGGTAVSVTADATDPEQVESAVAHALDAFGTIDVLHNNVGVAILCGPIDLDSSTSCRRC